MPTTIIPYIPYIPVIISGTGSGQSGDSGGGSSTSPDVAAAVGGTMGTIFAGAAGTGLGILNESKSRRFHGNVIDEARQYADYAIDDADREVRGIASAEGRLDRAGDAIIGRKRKVAEAVADVASRTAEHARYLDKAAHFESVVSRHQFRMKLRTAGTVGIGLATVGAIAGFITWMDALRRAENAENAK